MLARLRPLACIGGHDTRRVCGCQNPAQSLTCCFSTAFVLVRLIYLFMVLVCGWLVLPVRSDAAARPIDVATETAVAGAEGANLEQAAAEHEPPSGGGRCLG
jgi:hypothetical protein